MKTLVESKNNVLKMGDVVSELAERMEMTKTGTRKILDGFLDIIEDALSSGKKVSFAGHFNLVVTERAERMGHNPKTGEVMKIPACKAVKIVASSTLKEKVNKN